MNVAFVYLEITCLVFQIRSINILLPRGCSREMTRVVFLVSISAVTKYFKVKHFLLTSSTVTHCHIVRLLLLLLLPLISFIVLH